MRPLRCLFAAALATLPLLAAVPARADVPDVVTSPADFTTDSGETLRGLVYTPRDAAGPLPGMVLLGGSGPVKHGALVAEAKAFAAQGIAVFAHDKRTRGYSASHRDYAALADDAVRAVAMLRGRPGVDPRHVGIWGISEGGWVAPLAGARSAQVAFLVLASAPALTPMRTENWNTRNKIHAAGVRGPLVSVLSDRPLRILEDAGTFAESRYDPRPVLASVTQPVLAVYGSRDVQVPAAESAKALTETIGGHVSVRIMAGGDHLLREGAAILPGYPEVVGGWVRGVASGRTPAPVVDALPDQRAQSSTVALAAPWERWRVQLAVFVLIVLLPVAYPIGALIRWLRRRPVAGHTAARTLAVLVPLTALSALTYLYVVLTGSDYRGIYPGPVLAGRPVVWLILQTMAVATVVATVLTARQVGRERADRARLGVLLGGAALFVVWALYWGLLLP
ncbi:alpha/beta hydrolase [Actinoplanes sp. NEAU-A12]|uniref:Alpha/beta hydrolase n=1 Tax=Actinoplanes sandaracinus TaxID=3045177 RepID=A0ABT6WKJ4_9ACTN|nr:alpha/beta hydrolase [Actinoplanes sandaracinus]MDI6100256.1 alpha/beta hydrolase [Actinoplanes sandaracinus]